MLKRFICLISVVTITGCGTGPASRSSDDDEDSIQDPADQPQDPADSGHASHGGSEVCGNDLDEDFDGTLDNGCPCDARAAARVCSSTGIVHTAGTCRAGMQHCITGVTGGTWSACVGDVNPTPEVCDGQDNDCDGISDEECGAGGTTLTGRYYARTFSWNLGGTGIIPARQAHLLEPPVAEEQRCLDGQVRVDTPYDYDSYSSLRSVCTSSPPGCELGLLLDFDGEAWHCRACSVVVLYGGLYGDVVSCASRPPDACDSGVPTFRVDTHAWSCDPECDNVEYDQVSFEGRTMCVPC